MIPGLENAEFLRYGSIHRNTFLNAPALLNQTLQLRSHENIFFAGQITGVEGYVESTAMGLLAGIFAGHLLSGHKSIPPPDVTAMGALLGHLVHSDSSRFQPMNINFGLFPPLQGKIHRKERGHHYAQRALAAIGKWKEETGV
jgi:methylenetetrahydrofolate--tRNA-(uracil-5-)-methyltransferase